MTELDASGKIIEKDIRRLYIQDGLIVKYERDYKEGKDKEHKDEFFFENGRLVKKIEKDVEGEWDSFTSGFVLGSIGSVISGLPTPKQ